MTTKADYTNEEWELLSAGPLLAGLGVSLLDPGLLSGMQEGSAVDRAIGEAKASYAGNELVQGVLAELAAHGEAGKKKLAEGATTTSVLAKLVEIDAILDRKGKEGDETMSEGLSYRNFLYNIADRAANAAGGFMGLGDKVSEDEAYYLKKLKDILFREQSPAS